MSGSDYFLHADRFLQMFYTMLVICLNVIVQGGGSNLFPPDHPEFTEKEIQDRIKGSKIVILSEQVVLVSI
jgi:hypothetical protein